MRIEDINRYWRNGSTALHTAAYYGRDQIVRLLLENRASPSIKQRSNGLKPYEEARFQRTRDVFCHYRDHCSHYGISVYDRHTPWTDVLPHLNSGRKFLRNKLSKLLPEKDVDQNEMYEEIVNSINRFVDKLPLVNNEKDRIMRHTSTMRTTKDPRDLIRCYSTNTQFHRCFNELFAKHSINYFADQEVNIHDDYRVIKSFLQLTAMLMYDKRFDQYRYTGPVHRGMFLTWEELKKYQEGSKIKYKSWLSASKSYDIAQRFSDVLNHQGSLDHDRKQSEGISVICTYSIKDRRTGFDITTISDLGPDEQEVLIFPYSDFQVTHRYVEKDQLRITLEEETDD